MPTADSTEAKPVRARGIDPFVGNVVAARTPPSALASRQFQFRPFTLTDIRTLVDIAGRRHIGITSIGMPHPCTIEFARMWSSEGLSPENVRSIHWAATKYGDALPSGYAGLNQIDQERRQAELRIWVGSSGEHWSYAAEWSVAILQFALIEAGLGRIYALQLARHPIAGRVLSAIGMQRDGLLRKRIRRNGPFEDVNCWTVLKEEWLANRSQ